MIGTKEIKIKYIDVNGIHKEKWVNEYALFETIERLENNGCKSIVVE